MWEGEPLLVEAGPGTGKTRTLVRRIQRKLDEKSTPASFLALTFSRKASEEMRERIAAMNADASIEMWVGTFHQFGLELVSKWPLRFGRTSNVRPLDQTGQLELLEANLEKLPLKHFQNLYEPAYELVPVLKVISRCKDERITVDQYEAEAKAFKAAAKTDEEHEDAERELEIGAIYRIYEQELKNADAVDFGDLVVMAGDLVMNHPEVQAYVAGFKHILVDEFQDVNFASAELLKALTKAGVDVWVVADPRQSIYRFRGAQPSNVATFEKAFGGKRHALANNYRSHAPIVKAFARFSSAMGDGRMAATWTPTRGAGKAVSVTSAPSLSAEGEAIRDKIEELKAAGIPYSEQAILARSHLNLGRITGILEQLGVPLLYLGDLFERSEVRDLLSLASIDAELGGIGLVRVAALPDYAVPKADVLTLIAWARENKQAYFECLKRADEIEGLSAAGRVGFKKLGGELDGLQRASPWVLLTTWLFERSNYLHRMLAGDAALAQQRLIAIYQLLKVCGEYSAMGQTNRKRFLDRIRRIEALNEDTVFRAISSEASEIDAVRVMTIHGSKGLEFRGVHLPFIAAGYMPNTRSGQRIEPPPSLIRLVMEPNDRAAEEEGLFFVAMSRARDVLSMSYAQKYTEKRGSNPSKFLDSLAGLVSHVSFRGSGKSYVPERERGPVEPKEFYTERELEIYTQCPARYRNEYLDGLRGGRDESSYLRFHRCVYKTVGWLEAEPEKGNVVSVADALAHLAEVWAVEGPKQGQGFEKFHRKNAEGMVREMAETIAAETGTYGRGEWSVPFGKHRVLITPDRVLIDASGSVQVQRIRTGKKTKSEPGKPIYALLRKGARQAYGGKVLSVGAFYLATGEVMPVLAKDDEKVLAHYTDAIAGIERGEFHAKPETRRCANCPSYFICTGA
jgi:superfamily I DNA/RNA helicase